MSFKFPVTLLCLVIGACSNPIERKLEIFKPPAEPTEFMYHAVHDLDWR